MKTRRRSTQSRIVRRLKRTAMALVFAGLFCFVAGPLMAADLNLIINDTSNGPYNNTGIHDVNGYLILGNQSGDIGTYTITGNSAQTNVNILSGGNNGNPNGALIIGNAGTGSFTQGTDLNDNNNQVNVAGDLTLGQQTGSVGTYILNSGTLNVGGQLAVGGQSTGNNTFTQNGGALNLTNSASGNPDYVNIGTAGPHGFNAWGGALAVGGGIGNGDGSNSGGTGTYTLNNGVINTYNLLVGPTGTGTFNQLGGQVTTTYLTAGFSGNGTYNLQGDSTSTLNAYSETVGYAGTGTFNQSGGVNTIATTLAVGQQYSTNSPGSGAYNLTGGTLTTGNTFVGQGETGTFVLNDNDAAGATHNVNGNLILGALSIPDGVNPQFAGNGSYTITGNTSQLNVNFVPGGNGAGNPNGALIVGDFGTGSFTQGNVEKTDSPTVTVAGDLILGHQGSGSGPPVANSVGTYTLNSGTLTVGGSIGVGAASTATDLSGNPLNVFTQNGGTVTITGSAQYPPNPDYVGVGTNDHAGLLMIGGAAGPNNDGGSGAYMMNGGTLNAGLIEVGHAGIGIMTQSDGTVGDTLKPSIWLGNAGGSNGTYNLNGGVINAQNELIALGGTGTFNQTGGVNTISGLLDVGFQSAQGTYNLSGTSVLSAGRTVIGDGTADNGGYGLFFGAGGTLNISDTASLTTGDMTVGILNTGIVNQSGGTVSAASLTLGVIGTIPNGQGYYNLTGTGQLHVSGNETLGQFGYGQITQGTAADAGTTSNTVGGNLILGALDNIHPNTGPAPRAGEYILNTGTLSTTNTIVGDIGLGIFTQNGGTHTVANNLVVGNQSIPLDITACGGTCTSGGPSEGTYTFNGGTLTVGGQVIVGDAGTGTFNQNANLDLSASGGIVIGRSVGGTGTYNLVSGVTLTDSLIVGDAGTGTFNNNGGTHNVTGDLILGNQATGNGTYNLSGTGALATGTQRIGLDGTGVFHQTGGTNMVSGDQIIGQNNGAQGTYSQSGGMNTVNGWLLLGRDSGAQGTYTQTLGTTTVSGGLNVGQSGMGTYNLNGGSLGVTGDVTVAKNSGSTGTLNVADGALSAASVTNNGTLNYSAGSLILGGGTGTLTNNAGGQVNFSGSGTRIVNGNLTNSGVVNLAMNAEVNVLNQNTGGTINLNTNNLTVAQDYTNANFGVGNSFNRRANVTGAGLILASGDVAISLSGAGVTGGTSATPTLALGNVHVGANINGSFDINNIGTTGPAIRGAVQNTGISNAALGITAQNFGPIALSGSTAVNYTYAPTAGGALTGQTFNVVTNFDNVPGKTVSVTGAAYNLAAGNATPTPVVLGNQHVGGTNSQILTVSNTAPSGSFTEGLNAGFGANTGSATNNGGAISLLAGQGSNSTAMSVGVNTASAGAQSGTVTLNYVSDGTGTSGLGTTNVGSQVINVSGNVYRLANAQINNPGAFGFGNVHVGDTVQQTLSITNTAANDGFSEKLNAGFGGTSDARITTSGSINALGAGATNNTSMLIGVNTSAAGLVNGTATVTFASDGTGTSGLGITTLSSQNVNVSADITGGVYRLANPVINTAQPVDYGNVRIGTSVVPTTLSITNNVPNDGFSEKLNAAAGSTTGGATASGSFNLLGAGQTDTTNITVGLNTSVAGNRNGLATINFVSDGTDTSGLGLTTLASQNVQVNGSVYRLANPTVNTPSITLYARVGDASPSASIGITNTSPDIYTEGLKAGISTSSTGFSASGAINNLAAQGSDATTLKVNLGTGTAGLFTGTTTLGLASTGVGTTGANDYSLGTQNVTVNGKVYTPAVASVSGAANFGIVHVGDSPAQQQLTVKNAAASTALNDVLGGTFAVSGPFTGGSSIDAVTAGLSAGAAKNFAINLNTSTAGYYNSNATFTGVSHNGNMSDLNLTPVTAAISAQVNNYAVSEIVFSSGAGTFGQLGSTYTLNFGTLSQNSGTLNTTLFAENGAIGPWADWLSGNFSFLDSPDFGETGFVDFSKLAAGNTTGALSLAFNTVNLGTFSDTIILYSSGGNDSGYNGALGNITLNITGQVVQSSSVPEPTTMLLLGLGLMGLAGVRRKFKE